MDKPITMIVKETKAKLANVCNESGLPPIILDLILQGIYSEVHTIAEKQTLEEENVYRNSLRDKGILKEKEVLHDSK